MAKNELQVQPNFGAGDVASKFSNHGCETVFSRESTPALEQGVTSAGRREILEEAGAGLVGDRQMVHIEDRVPQPGVYELVTEVVHVREAMGVRFIINLTPRATNFLQAVGTQCRKNEQAALPQYSSYL